MIKTDWKVAEFFAGGGMARLGLGEGFEYVAVVDWCPRKAATYRANFGDEVTVADVANLANMPEVDLAWGSPPCTDVSVAGPRAGIHGERSGAFWPWWSLVKGRARVVVLENVEGLLTAGIDQVTAAMREAGYQVEVYQLDAIHWLPQSRPRVFVVAHQRPHPRIEIKVPRMRLTLLEDVLDEQGAWWDPATVDRWVALMNHRHRSRFESGVTCAGFRRGRGVELRDDGVAGCLRTPSGGSSRQLVVSRGRMRWLTGREGARLMGIPESYVLPVSETQALQLVGDGVAVPVVRALRQQVLEPLLAA